MDRNVIGALYILKQKFPRIGGAKIQEGIFVTPQIREVIQDKIYDNMLN